MHTCLAQRPGRSSFSSFLGRSLPPLPESASSAAPNNSAIPCTLPQGKARDVKQHKWFEGFDWDALAARKIAAPRKPRDDAAKRIRELAVRPAIVCGWQA